jgi:hypothetical protein
MNTKQLLGIGMMGFVAAGNALAGIVYDNGPINGTVDGWTINFGYQVSDSFTVASAVNLASAQISLWLVPKDVPATVDWSIGTSPFGSDISSGTATLNNTFLYNNTYGYDLYNSTLALSGAVSPSTTYYFTLQNATVSNGDAVYWDENGGPSSASKNSVGTINSEAFTLYSAVPEPKSYATLSGLGLLGLVAWRRARNHAA